MVGVSIGQRSVLKGRSISKVEKHWPRGPGCLVWHIIIIINLYGRKQCLKRAQNKLMAFNSF